MVLDSLSFLHARTQTVIGSIFVCECVHFSRQVFGDTKVPFSIQSACKPLNYALALNDLGSEVVHRHVGHEPSGESFNQIKLGHGSKL